MAEHDADTDELPQAVARTKNRRSSFSLVWAIPLVAALIGIRSAAGTVDMKGENLATWDVRRRREAGMAYIPQDRHREGLCSKGTC